MAIELSRARDEYEIYYAEKIWALVPEIYRAEDLDVNVLRQIVEVIAEQAAVTRRSIDRLWEDQHIETCDDWAVPYIGDLLATRLLSERDPRARRVDVARTIHYRRRRGTPSLLEALVREISGWDVVLVEAFRRLVRTPHRLDAFPVALGRATRTPAGGTANLRNPRASEIQPGAFDEFFHTPDVRQLHGRLGRFNIPKLNFHLFRLRPFPIVDVTPVQLQDPGPITFTVDPSGRDIPLFSRGITVNTGSLRSCGPPWAELPTTEAQAKELADCERRCVSTQEWEVAKPMSCRLLTDAAFVLTLENVVEAKNNAADNPDAAVEIAALDTLTGLRFENEARLRARLTQLGVSFSPVQPDWYRELLRDTVTRDSAKRNLLPLTDGGADDEISDVEISLNLFFDVAGDPDVAAFPFDATTGADLSSRQCHPIPADIGIQLLVHPELGRFAFPQAQVAPPEEEDPDPKPDPAVDPFEDFVPPADAEPEAPPGDAPPFEAPPPDPAPDPTPDPTPDPGPDPAPDPTPDPGADPGPDPAPDQPPGVPIDGVALFARSGRIQIGGDGTEILGEDGVGFATIVNAGTMTTTIQAGGNQELGDIWSVPEVFIGNNVHVHGDVHSGDDLTLQSGVVIDGDVEDNTDLSSDLASLINSLDFTVDFPGTGSNTTADSSNSPLILPPHTSGNLTRGVVTIANGGTLRLSSGVYFFESFQSEPAGTLEINANAGKIYVFARNDSTHRASLTFLAGEPNDFVMVVMGTQASLDSTDDYAGIVLAPNAQLNIQQSVVFEGAYFAATVITQPNQTFILDPWDGNLPEEFVDFGAPRALFRRPAFATGGVSTRMVTVAGDQYTISVDAPGGVTFDEIFLHTDGGPLTIGDNVLQAVGGFGTIVNISGQPTTIGPSVHVGPSAQVGNVWASGTVTLNNGVHVHGRVRTSAGAGSVVVNGTVTQDQPALTGVDLELENLTLPGIPGPIVFTTGLPIQTIASPANVTLAPGDYGAVTVESGASLRLGPGEYRMDELTLQAGAELRLDLSGPIQLAVRNVLDLSGGQRVLWGSSKNFTLVYLGTAPLNINVPFAGYLFAPQAVLTLETLAHGQFQGAFFAQSLTLEPGSPVLAFAGEAQANLYVYGFPGPVGAGAFTRELPKPEDVDIVETGGGVIDPAHLVETGALTIGDNFTYRLAMNDDHQIVDTALQAGDGERPYLLLEGGEDGSIAQLFPKAPEDEDDRLARKFIVSGVWIGSLDSGLSDWFIERAIPGVPELTTTSGFDWEEIVLRHVTLDPGGTRADGFPIAPVRLFIRGRVQRLIIESSIVASVIVDPESDEARVETLTITNSIVDAQQSPMINDRRTAISNPVGTVELSGVTVFGDVRAGILNASNSIVMGRLIVANTQDSCFRFSATSLGDVPETEGEPAAPRLPKLFRVPDIDFIQPYFFSSMRFGDPGYASLSLAAPESLRTGAENTSEMGAFSFLIREIKLSSVITKVDEFKPVAVLPQFILENESTPVCEPTL